MRKIRWGIFLVLLFCLFGHTKTVFAHSADVTATNIFLPMPEEHSSEVVFDLYLPWAGAAYLSKEDQLISSPSAQILKSHLDMYVPYVQERLRVLNGSGNCEMRDVIIPEQSDAQILLGSGLQLRGRFVCSEPLGTMLVSNTLFMDVFALQTNVVNFYVGSTQEQLAKSVLLTHIASEVYFNYGNVEDEVEASASAAPRETNSTYKLSLASEGLLNIIVDVSHQPWWLVLGVVFVLGGLHTMEAGHSKSILAAMVVDRKVHLKQGLLYAVVFTLTHVADIILMGLVLLSVNSFTNVYDKLPYLQIAAVYGLLMVSFYLFIKQIIELIQVKVHGHSHDHSHDHEHGHSHELVAGSFKQQLLVGFIAGLAPCLFGWSVFMLVVSTGNLWLVIPVILAFALGILASLSLVVVSVWGLKAKIFTKQEWIGRFSPLFSAGLLFAFALWQAVK